MTRRTAVPLAGAVVALPQQLRHGLQLALQVIDLGLQRGVFLFQPLHVPYGGCGLGSALGVLQLVP